MCLLAEMCWILGAIVHCSIAFVSMVVQTGHGISGNESTHSWILLESWSQMRDWIGSEIVEMQP